MKTNNKKLTIEQECDMRGIIIRAEPLINTVDYLLTHNTKHRKYNTRKLMQIKESLITNYGALLRCIEENGGIENND